ncbi:MAG: hypothetical protein K5984_04895 [Bacteroidales bacterium]|nr:hypothetical protein [Bacteroidales bacterium]
MDQIQYFCVLSTMAYITGGVILAAVRWFHMCQPYDREPRYYYPARRYMAAMCILTVSLLPFVFEPDSVDALILVKTYFLPSNILMIALVLMSYFGRVMNWEQFSLFRVVALSLLVVILGLAISVALIPGEQFRDAGLVRIAEAVIYALGFFQTLVFVVALKKVRHWAINCSEDEFSNPMDFPVPFAKRVAVIGSSAVLLIWCGAIFDNPLVLGIVELLLTVILVVLVIVSLHPNRQRECSCYDLQEEAIEVADGNFDEIRAAIKQVVETERSFLEPHITLQDVASKCGYNRSYVAKIIKSEYGGFFNYINSLRLDYAEEYHREHPDASVAELVDESGFGSRQTYYNVKSRLRPDLL